MYIDIVPNRKSRPAILLRESAREGKRIVKRTVANLSSLSLAQAEAIREVLKGKTMRPVEELFEIVRSRAHGAVKAVTTAMVRLGIVTVLDRKPSRERSLVAAMIAARVLDPQSKLATTRSWGHSTLGEHFAVEDADEQELHTAMDWLLARQHGIEKRLAKRHLHDGGRVLYDLSSSYFEGERCPLAKRGHSRDGKKGKLQVNYGLLTDARGCPVAISVFEGNTADPQTLLDQLDKLQQDFALVSVTLVGDRGMISQKQIDTLDERSGVDWITALKTGAIRKLVDAGAIQLGLFDERNLYEFTHEDFPGERLVVCRNPQLAELRAHKRRDLLAATTTELETVARMVANGRLKQADKIGVRAGKVVNKYKVAKHFVLEIDEGRFAFRIDEDKVAAEAMLDGLYVIRTSLPSETVSTDDAVRHYKDLSRVEIDQSCCLHKSQLTGVLARFSPSAPCCRVWERGAWRRWRRRSSSASSAHTSHWRCPPRVTWRACNRPLRSQVNRVTAGMSSSRANSGKLHSSGWRSCQGACRRGVGLADSPWRANKLATIGPLKVARRLAGRHRSVLSCSAMAAQVSPC